MAAVERQIKSDYLAIVDGFENDDVAFIKSLPRDRLRRAFEPHAYGLPAFHLAVRVFGTLLNQVTVDKMHGGLVHEVLDERRQLGRRRE